MEQTEGPGRQARAGEPGNSGTERRTFVLIILGALIAIGPFSIDMYLPGLPGIARDLGTDVAHVGLTLTSYFVGISIGQLLYGPALDRYGRKNPVLVGLALFVVAAVGCAFSPSVGCLVAMRFFLGLGSCVGMVASSAIVRDLFSGKEVAKALSAMMTVFGIAPIIAPSVGGMIISGLGWRYVFGVLAVIGGCVLAAIWRFVHGAKGPDPSVSLRPSVVAVNYLRVFRVPQFLLFAATALAGTAGLFSYITGSPFVFINLFGLSATQYGWVFGANALLYVFGTQLNRLLLRKLESREVLLVVGSMECLIMVALVGGSVTGVLPAWGFLGLIAFYMFCHACVSPNAGALALLPFSRNVGSAAASFASMQMISGAIASALLTFFHNGTRVPMAGMMGVCAGLTLTMAIVGSFSLKRSSPAS